MHSMLLISLITTLLTGNALPSGNAGQPESEIKAGHEYAIAETATGKVAGFIEDGLYIYKGIPYATADRFMPPKPAAAWTGVKSCRAYGSVSPQGVRWGWSIDEMAYTSDWNDGHPGEDCLRLNIWTQGLNDGKKRPVMVWLHGGGYAARSGQELPAYDGARLCKRGDIVMVSLNHRLNVLGFLDLSGFGPKYAQSGNVGMLDIVEALRWVKQNIAAFGGDPNNVTIFGQSGGGGKVSTLMAIPSAKGLFHKAIVESGSMLQTMESKYSKKIGQAVVEELGLQPSQVDMLAKIPYDKLLEAGEKAIRKVKAEAQANGFQGFLFGWAPTVDGNVLPRQPFFPDAPGQSAEIPMIIGTTLHEFMSSSRIPGLAQGGMDTAKVILKRTYGDKVDEFLRKFSEVYPNHTAADLFDVDLMFRPQAVTQATLKAQQKGAPVYMYLFTWESPVLNGMLRSSHCMELPFVFDNIYRSRYMTGGSAEAMSLAEKMSEAWISFARTGKPEAKGLPAWEPYTPDNGNTMIFNKSCHLLHHHDKVLLDFISSFPPRRL